MSDLSRLPTRGSSSPAPPPPPPPAPVQQGHNKYSNRAASALARFAQPFLSGSRPPSPHTSGVRTDLSAAAVRSTRSRPEYNLRNAIISYSSTHHVVSGLSARHKDQLTVKDVKWSHGLYDQIIATAVANGRIVVYDLHRTGLEFCRFQGHSRQVHRLAFNPHHPAWLLSGSQDATIRMWDLRAAPTDHGVAICGSKEQYNGNSDAVRDVRWSPSDGVMFATATDSGAVQLWDCRKTSAPLMRITAHDRPCFSVDWHPDGKHIVSGGTDRQVKVWDFSSSAERRQKPAFQFRTPQAVLNVRWRPPSWARESEGSGDWQSSQVVTSYDKEDPRIHLWDLRRPHIPFREFDRYDTSATDLLWHSKDLLWTVGDGGVFTQTDIRYAPLVINQRPTCSVAWSPSGEVIAFAQKRPRRSIPGLGTTEFVGHSGEENSSGEAFSQSPGEDIIDEPSFASMRSRRSKSNSVRTSKSLGSTPPAATDLIPILPLDKVLSKIKPLEQQQMGIVGSIAGTTMDRETFQYLARHYSPLLRGRFNGMQADPLRLLLDSLNHNAASAENISLLKLAQTWRIVKYAIIQELQLRARELCQSPEKTTRNLRKKPSEDGAVTEKLRNLEDTRHDKMKSRLFKGVMECEAPKHALADPESASNMTTPLARPLPDSPTESYGSSNSQMTSLNSLGDIQPLPPSLLSSNRGTMTSNDWSSMSDIGPRPVHQFQHRESNESEEGARALSDSPPSDPPCDLNPPEIEEEQRSAPLAIAGRADWHVRNRLRLTKETSEVDEFDQKMEDKRAAIRDYKHFPKKLLSLESHAESKPGLHRHESSESFPMFSASTASSHPSKSVGTSFSSAAKPYHALEDGEEGSDHDIVAARNDNLIRTRSDSILTSGSIAEEEIQSDELFGENINKMNRRHLDRPSSPPPLLKESTPLKIQTQETPESTFQPGASNGSSVPALPGVADGLVNVSIPIPSDQRGNNPWSAEMLLKEAIRHYHTSTHVDVQSSAHLLQKLHVLFEDCENIFPNEESEAIFQVYNEHLLRQSMYMEAAELRLLCVPSYPAVYDYAQADTYMNVFCFTCKRPYENPKNDNTRCYRCDTPQDPCTICMSLQPPPEWVAEHCVLRATQSNDSDSEDTSLLVSSSRSSIKTEPIPASELQHIEGMHPETFQPSRPKGSTLWSWCQGCGHGGHLACISTWLKDIAVSEGGCATPGCMHDCGPGPRREHNRNLLFEESKRRDSASRKAGVGFVKRDTWTRGESKAVEKVRGMLGVGPAIGSASTTTTVGSGGPSAPSSNMMSSPKKVRLVTPSEQGKPSRPGSARTSFGCGSGVNT
ncbi:hypothetical protein AOCH_007596 [Aspergillus ochraceoroseus]|uniref:Uncharacterized protein n=1 Tax=Aspergillus ochraceoroseus TaxID=138278 RepID=A0A0F8WTT9_9EURO|nr:hypothetical protein AOCH_007596 [Aspergillus ochraceoroseus]